MSQNIIADFFKNEYKKLRNYVRKLLRNTTDRDAEDVIQDVALNIFNKADFDRPLENLAAYIYRALHNHVIDIYRKKKYTEAVEEESLPPDNTDMDIKIAGREAQEKLFNALEQLPQPQRDIWIAVELEGGTYREMSEKWKIPQGTLLARKHRADKKLRDLLKDFYKSL